MLPILIIKVKIEEILVIKNKNKKRMGIKIIWKKHFKIWNKTKIHKELKYIL